MSTLLPWKRAQNTQVLLFGKSLGLCCAIFCVARRTGESGRLGWAGWSPKPSECSRAAPLSFRPVNRVLRQPPLSRFITAARVLENPHEGSRLRVGVEQIIAAEFV